MDSVKEIEKSLSTLLENETATETNKSFTTFNLFLILAKHSIYLSVSSSHLFGQAPLYLPLATLSLCFSSNYQQEKTLIVLTEVFKWKTINLVSSTGIQETKSKGQHRKPSCHKYIAQALSEAQNGLYLNVVHSLPQCFPEICLSTHIRVRPNIVV